MTEPKNKSEQEKEEEKQQYLQLVVDSCNQLIPHLTNFPTFESAPEHTRSHLGLIVDATFKSILTDDRTDLFSKQHLRFNKKRIESKLFLKDINAQQTSRLQNLFNQFVLYVTHQLNWKLTTEITDKLVLPKILPVVREKQMFNLGLAKHYRNIFEMHNSNLKNLKNEQLIGLLAISIVFDSHWLHIDFIESILSSTPNNLIWLTDEEPILEMSALNDKSQPIRLHNQTLVLLLEKFRRQLGATEGLFIEPKLQYRTIRKAVQKLCQNYLKNQSLALSDLKIPTQLQKIIEIAGTDYFMNRPAFFHAAMTGNLQQTPLAIETKLRILIGKPVKRTTKIKSLKNNITSELSNDLRNKLVQHELIDENTGSPYYIKPLSWQLNAIKLVLKSLVNQTKNKSVYKLQDLLENADPNFSLMSLWLLAWLKEIYAASDNHFVGRKAKKTLKKNSILRYFSTVYRHILPVFDNIDVASLEEDEWIELLQECIDSSNDTQLFQPLSRFVRFLTAQFDIPILPLQDLESNKGFYNVNANLITPFEIYEILECLPTTGTESSVTSRMQACALILGFFCGLRRKEVLGLRVIDIYGHKHRPFLFLRTHKDRSLKNAYSRRRLDLVDLIPEPYLHILMDWHKHQSSLDMKFLMSFSEHEIGNDRTIIDPLQAYCRQTTGDETFVFHGLRHSFANLYLIRILQISRPALRKWLGTAKRNHLKTTEVLTVLDQFYSIDQAKLFLRKYFPSENQRLPRSTLLQLAELLGHKVPNTTSRSYLHLIDEIEADYHPSVENTLKEAWIDQYWSFNQPYQRSRFKKQFLNSDKQIDDIKLVRALYEKTLNQTVSCQLDAQILDPIELKIDDGLNDLDNHSWPNPILVANLYPIYKQLFIQKTSIDDIAAAFVLPKEDVEKIQNNALAISKIKTSKGKLRFMHPLLLRRSNALEKKLNQLMKKIAQSELNFNDIQAGLQLYLQRSQTKNAYRVTVKNAQEFKDYVQLLKSIKLTMSQVGIRIYPSNCFDKTDNELTLYWGKIFQESVENKIKLTRIKIFSSIATKSEFGQIEIEPLIKQNKQFEFLEHYQYAIYLIQLLNTDGFGS